MKFWHRLGLGLGDIELVIPSASVMFGQVLDGELMFNLTEETQGRALFVSVKAFRETQTPNHQYDPYREGSQRYNRDTEVLFHSQARLDGERLYSSGFYPFQLRMPFGIDVEEPDGIEQVMDFVAAFRHGTRTSRGPIVWELTGELDIPWSASLKRTLTLDVHHAAPQMPSYSGRPGIRAMETAFCQVCQGPFSSVYGCGSCQQEPAPAPASESAPLRPESTRSLSRSACSLPMNQVPALVSPL